MSIDQAAIAKKISKLILILLFAFLLLLVRVAFLTFSDRETALERAQKPQRRLIIDSAVRAEISDRMGVPLALNEPQYSLQFSYRPLLEIPRRVRRKLDDGTSLSTFPRREYISQLSDFLHAELGVDRRSLEDRILAEASLIPDLPITIVDGMSEELYFKWKHLERKWPGMVANYKLVRSYPQGGSAGDLLGYVGPIQSTQFERISTELKSLEDYLRQREDGLNPFLPVGFEHPKEVEKRAEILYEEAISLVDEVGICGLEKSFDHALRGLRGKHYFEKSRKKNVLTLLPGGESKISGQHLRLTLSSDLQKKAEELLRISEEHYMGVDNLWLHGGVIVAMDPVTGEVIAMASEPHIQPQLVLEKKKTDPNKVAELFWTDEYLKKIWDGRATPNKEMGPLVNPLTYDHFIDLTFHPESKAKAALLQIKSAYQAKQLTSFIAYISAIYEKSPREMIDQMEEISFEEIASSQEPDLLSRFLSTRDFLLSIPKNDRVLVLDFLRLFTWSLNLEFLSQNPMLSMSAYMEFSRLYLPLLSKCKEASLIAFKKTLFETWRETHFDAFLKEKRKEEKENRRYTKPYTEYLEQEFKTQFSHFWEENKELIIKRLIFGSHEEDLFWKAFVLDLPMRDSMQDTLNQAKAFLISFHETDQLYLLKHTKSCEDYREHLWGKYPRLRNYALSNFQTLQDLALSFFRPMTSLHRSMSFREYIPQGSLFKLLISYQGLIEQFHEHLHNNLSLSHYLNPLTLIDDNHPKTQKIGDQILGFFEDRTPIRRLYKGGIMPRSSHTGIGRVDLLGALEQSSNLYFSILASDYISSVDSLLATTRRFGFGEKTGIELPGEIAGTVPKDLKNNPANLYAFAIGQHSLTVTPLQSAKMVASMANGGKLTAPKICLDLYKRQIDSTYHDEPFDISNELIHLGLPVNLLSLKDKKLRFQYNLKLKDRPSETVEMPELIAKELREGMKRVVHGERGTARLAAVRRSKLPASIIDLYKTERDYMIGKTSTAEIMLKTTLDSESPAKIKNHVWFGAICYDRPIHEEGATPDLVIIVALKYRAAGHEAAPIAAALHHEWRKLQEQARKQKPL